MSEYITSTLEEGEKIEWEGRQDLRSSILAGFGALIVLVAVGWGIAFMMSIGGGTCTVNGEVRPIEECARIGKYIAYGMIALGLLSPFLAYCYYRVTYYAITSKRVIIKSGLIGADLRSVYYEQMRSVFVDVGIVGKLFGTGTVMIDTGQITQTDKGTKTIYDRLANIRHPYDVYKILQERVSNRKESLSSGRADYESNTQEYKEYVQGTERMKRDA